MIVSTQAVKKGASQTIVGLIFGCYAVSNLIGSLILGKYVSRKCHLNQRMEFHMWFSAQTNWFNPSVVLSDCPNWCKVHAHNGAFCVVVLHHPLWVSVGFWRDVKTHFFNCGHSASSILNKRTSVSEALYLYNPSVWQMCEQIVSLFYVRDAGKLWLGFQEI